MIINCADNIILDDIFLQVRMPDRSEKSMMISPHVYIKLEGLSITNSVKLKSAKAMIDKYEQEGRLLPGGELIESSSGNLGLALSMICAVRGYHFTCVSDPNISTQTARLIQVYGAELIIVRERDKNGGFLASRIELIKKMLQKTPSLIWINQYENKNNAMAHYKYTAPNIYSSFERVDYIFIGAGTTGTLCGVSRYFKEKSPRTRIVAVDSVGSVTFGTPASSRFIPGLGTSAPPPISKDAFYDYLLMVKESDAVRMCRKMAKYGLLLGGSSGSVLFGVWQMLPQFESEAVIVAISPDMGDRYLDTVYSDSWVTEKFGIGALNEDEFGAGF